jgi:hypothetical protein
MGMVIALTFSGFAAWRCLGTEPADDWEKKHDMGNRYEGLRDFPVGAGPVIDVRGFFAFRELLDPSADTSLKVKFYLAEASHPVRITASEIHRKIFYWMRAKDRTWTAGWNTFAPWPTRDVMRHAGVGIDSLAVLVRIDGQPAGSGTIAPAVLCSSTCNVRLSDYVLYLVPSKNLTGITYTVNSRGNQSLVSGALGPKSADVAFPLAFSLSGVPDGHMTITISSPVQDSVGVPPETVFAFDHIANPQH